MLRVTVDLIPFGIEEGKKNLYTLEIANIGSVGVTLNEKGEERFSYSVRSIDEEGNRIDHGVVVREFDRTKPAYELVNLIANKLHKKGIFKR